jgi:hypothetical protein
MKTIKLKKKPAKRDKRTIKSSKKMIGGTVSKLLKKKSVKSVRHSQRLAYTDIEEIPVLILGSGGPEQPTYGNQVLTESVIKKFVDENIIVGYQIVCLPMPPDESHSIVVNLVPRSGVKIVDWGGEANQTEKDAKWKNYTKFINYLKKKYKTLSYEPIDPDIDKIADDRCEINHGQGGCSEYVHNWLKKHFHEENKGVIFITTNT